MFQQWRVFAVTLVHEGQASGLSLFVFTVVGSSETKGLNATAAVRDIVAYSGRDCYENHLWRICACTYARVHARTGAPGCV